MSVISQADIKINRKVLPSFQQVTLIQDIYGIDHFEIVCRYDAIEQLDGFLIEKSRDFLGFPITILTKQLVKDQEQDGIVFEGYVTEIHGARSGQADGDHVYIVGSSALIALNQRPTYRAFIDKSLEDIVKAVLSAYEIKSKVSVRTRHTFPYVVQYGESDLEFLRRLSIRHGEWFFFDGQKVIFGEVPVKEGSLTIGTDLKDFRYELKINPVKFKYSALDPLNHDMHAYSSGSSKTNSHLNIYGKHALDRSKKLYADEGNEYYDHVNTSEGAYKEGIDGAGEVQEAADAIRLAHISGASEGSFLSIGLQVKINCVKQDSSGEMDYGKYLVTSVQHTFENTLNYRNVFTAVPAKAGIPEYTNTREVRRTAQQVGLVVDNKDPQKLGRVKVHFGWMEGGQSTPWISMVSPYTQKDAGFYFVPAVDSRVLLGFEDGDVEKPYCIGTMYDNEKSPDAAWTGNYTDENSKTHAIRTASGQTIELHDDKGKEKIRIYSKDGENLVEVDDAGSSINIKSGSINLDAKSIKLTAGSILMSAGSISLDADATVNVFAGASYSLNAANISESAQSSFNMQSQEMVQSVKNRILLSADEIYSAATKKLINKSQETMTISAKDKIDQQGGKMNILTKKGNMIIHSKGTAELSGKMTKIE